MEDDGKLILWGTLVVLLLIIIGIINPFLLILILSIFIYIESDYYKIIPEFTFTFIVKPTKLKQHEFKEQLYNK